jgi:hypothetical protein
MISLKHLPEIPFYHQGSLIPVSEAWNESNFLEREASTFLYFALRGGTNGHLRIRLTKSAVILDEIEEIGNLLASRIAGEIARLFDTEVMIGPPRWMMPDAYRPSLLPQTGSEILQLSQVYRYQTQYTSNDLVVEGQILARVQEGHS